MPSAGGAFAFMDPLELTRALVALETPTGSERPAIDFLDGLLRRAGYRTVAVSVTTTVFPSSVTVLVISIFIDCAPIAIVTV